jgi:hypothetical protein
MGFKWVVDQANTWAELTGTAFYKVFWNNNGGRAVGENLFEGDVSVTAVSPFEIYPESLTNPDLNAQSIIHAKPYRVDVIKKIWGVDVVGVDTEVYDFNRTSKNYAAGKTVLQGSAVVIECYDNGVLTIVAGDKILYSGAYTTLPFVRQTAESFPASFYGKSVIERAIPVQRAYNAIKNRKNEFLNRFSCGVLAVEDGSVDVESLENDGLAPGTIIQYRQGSAAPKFLENMAIPTELNEEENKLLNELATITGGSDISRGDFSNVSGVALDIMVAQDRLRIKRSVESGKLAREIVASKVLQLYKTYAATNRLDRLARGKIVELISWSRNDIQSTEVEMLAGASEMSGDGYGNE